MLWEFLAVWSDLGCSLGKLLSSFYYLLPCLSVCLSVVCLSNV